MGIQLTWLGHSSFMVDIDGSIILVDPFLTGNPFSTVEPATVPADFILLTHGHSDHLGDTVEIAKRTNAVVVSMVEIASWLQSQGVTNTRGQNTGGYAEYPFGGVKFVRADHSSSLPGGIYGGLASGIVLFAQGKKIYFAGDTALFTDMRLIGQMLIDLAVIPIGDNFTMGIDNSVKSLEFIKPRAVIPCHYNTFPMIQQDVTLWAKRVYSETDAKPIVVDPGQPITVD